MSAESKIEWTDATWNPWHGCKKVSAGCKNCYMFRDKERWKKDPTIVTRSSDFAQPVKWKEPRMIFTCSWSDFFIEEADQWRDAAWDVIRATPQHTYQILTKRPERILAHLPDDWGDGYPNVWLGVSVEDQKTFEERALIFWGVHAKIKFMSFEPLLSEINLFSDAMRGRTFDIKHKAHTLALPFHWTIIGGESGNLTGKYTARETEIPWILELGKSCIMCGAEVFIKQVGTVTAKKLGLSDRHGRDMDEWPDNIKIRDMPVIREFTP